MQQTFSDCHLLSISGRDCKVFAGVCQVLFSTRGRIGSLLASGTRFFPSPTSDSFHLPVSSLPPYERDEYFAGRS